ncbi:hypothetical protein JL722_5097 [Aureococcus anophagefferens]|nr:hypothetical protein JL722_5097 [Aureococcus anophagefferens]
MAEAFRGLSSSSESEDEDGGFLRTYADERASKRRRMAAAVEAAQESGGGEYDAAAAAAADAAFEAAGCAVPATAKPAAYRTSSAKKADADSFPCVVAAPGGVDLATLGFGVKKLRCHNAFVEGWLDRKTWREAAATPRGRCSMVVTSFVEGITARRPDDAVFFILGLRVGDEFVILTTAAKRSALLGERARAKEGWGAGRYPIVADGARAAAWATADGPEAAHRLVAELDASTLSNELGLVLGANRKRSLPSPGQKTLGAFFGSPAKKEAPGGSGSPGSAAPAEGDGGRRLGGSPRETAAPSASPRRAARVVRRRVVRRRGVIRLRRVVVRLERPT